MLDVLGSYTAVGSTTGSGPGYQLCALYDYCDGGRRTDAAALAGTLLRAGCAPWQAIATLWFDQYSVNGRLPEQ